MAPEGGDKLRPYTIPAAQQPGEEGK